jgi:hypothetical protein
VPRKVLKERFEEQPLEDELAAAATGDSSDDDDDGIDSYDTNEIYRESAAFSPSPNLDGNPHDRNVSKDLTQRTTPRPLPHDKAKDGGAGNSVLVACLAVRCYRPASHTHCHGEPCSHRADACNRLTSRKTVGYSVLKDLRNSMLVIAADHKS